MANKLELWEPNDKRFFDWEIIITFESIINQLKKQPCQKKKTRIIGPPPEKIQCPPPKRKELLKVPTESARGVCKKDAKESAKEFTEDT